MAAVARPAPRRRSAAPAALLLLLLAAAASSAAAVSLDAVLANTTVIPFDLLENPLASAATSGGRALLAAQLDEWKRSGRYTQIANPDMPDRRSSTGQVAIHAALIPGTYKIILFGRNLPLSGPKSTPEPGVGGNVSTVYDVKVLQFCS